MLDEIATLSLPTLFCEQAAAMTAVLVRLSERLKEKFPPIAGLPAALVHPTELSWSRYSWNFAATNKARLSCHGKGTTNRIPRASALRRLRLPHANEFYFRPLHHAQVGERTVESYLDIVLIMDEVNAWRTTLREAMKQAECVPNCQDLLRHLNQFQMQFPGTMDLGIFAVTQSPKSLCQWQAHLTATQTILYQISNSMHRTNNRMRGMILPILREKRIVPFSSQKGLYLHMMSSEVYLAKGAYVTCWRHIPGKPEIPTRQELLKIRRRSGTDGGHFHAFSTGIGHGSVTQYLQHFELIVEIFKYYERLISYVKLVFAPIRTFHRKRLFRNNVTDHTLLFELDRFCSPSFGAQLETASLHYALLGPWSQMTSTTKTSWNFTDAH